MKETLYDRVVKMRNRILERISILRRNIEDYKKEGNWEDAMKNDIKARQLEMVAEELNSMLAS